MFECDQRLDKSGGERWRESLELSPQAPIIKSHVGARCGSARRPRWGHSSATTASLPPLPPTISNDDDAILGDVLCSLALLSLLVHTHLAGDLRLIYSVEYTQAISDHTFRSRSPLLAYCSSTIYHLLCTPCLRRHTGWRPPVRGRHPCLSGHAICPSGILCKAKKMPQDHSFMICRPPHSHHLQESSHRQE